MQEFKTVNGVAAKGGSMGSAGPVIAQGFVFVPSGYFFGERGTPGNALLAFSPE
jgi:polyvinyl alcohol dehydrogenase (cytochrome)